MKKLLMFLFSMLVWILFVNQLTIPVVILGLGLSLLSSYLFGDMVFRFISPKITILDLLVKVFYSVLILTTFTYDALLSAIKVSFHTFEKKPSFSPGIVKVKTKLTSKTAITILSNLITLTPGTLVVDFDPVDNIFHVHWIDVKSNHEAEIKKEIIGRHEDWIAHIFESNE